MNRPNPPGSEGRTRRSFLASATGLGIGFGLAPGITTTGLQAASPIAREGSPKFHLGLAAYSFREHFRYSRGNEQQPPGDGPPRDLAWFIDFCADHGAAAELTSYFFPPDPGEEYLLALKHHAFLRGVPVSGTAVGNDFAFPEGDKRDQQIGHVKTWIDRSAVLGAPHIRVFAGPAKDGLPVEESKKLCISALQECCDYAATKGVFLGLENHGGIVAEADDLLEIVEAVDSPWFGINLDTGNFHTADPYGDLARCAPYSINVQVKTEIRPRGAPREAVDLHRIVGLLRDANYQGFVTLEFEESADPFTGVPEWLDKLGNALATP